MKMKFSALIILILTLLFLSCNCDDILGKDDDPDYPVPDHGNTVIEETQDDIENGGTLTLSSGVSCTYYGEVGATVLQEISIGERDVIDNEIILWSESELPRDSMKVEGPIPSGISADSLYAVWFDAVSGTSGVVENSGGADRYEFTIPGDASFYEVRWPIFYAVPGMRRTNSDYTIPNVPYYEQYSTNHCWACATAMLLHYYSPSDPVYEDKMWEVVARNSHYDGYPPMSMRYTSSYSNYMAGELGVTPRFEIEDWAGSLGDFIESSISDSHYVLGLSTDHMIILTGWWLNGFLCNDPQQATGNIYRHKDWDVYVTDNARACGLFTNNHLVVTIPRSTASGHPGPTLSIGNPEMPPYGIILDPDTNSIGLDFRQDMAKIKIDDMNDNSGGTNGLHWVARSIGSSPKPTIRSDWNLHARVRVYNPSPVSANYMLSAILQDGSGNNLYTSPAVTVTVAGYNFTEVTVDTIPLDVIAVADTHFLIVNLYDETGLSNHYDRLKIHVPINEKASLNIGHCNMHYAVWGYYSSGSDFYTSMVADCDLSYNSAEDVYEGTWDNTAGVGSVAFSIQDETAAVDSVYFQSSDDRGTHEMASVNIPYASSSPLGPGPRYYLEGAEVCGHTAQLDVDWSDAGWGVMTNFECVATGFYMSHMDIVFSP